MVAHTDNTPQVDGLVSAYHETVHTNTLLRDCAQLNSGFQMADGPCRNTR